MVSSFVRSRACAATLIVTVVIIICHFCASIRIATRLVKCDQLLKYNLVAAMSRAYTAFLAESVRRYRAPPCHEVLSERIKHEQLITWVLVVNSGGATHYMGVVRKYAPLSGAYKKLPKTVAGLIFAFVGDAFACAVPTASLARVISQESQERHQEELSLYIQARLSSFLNDVVMPHAREGRQSWTGDIPTDIFVTIADYIPRAGLDLTPERIVAGALIGLGYVYTAHRWINPAPPHALHVTLEW